MHDNIQLVIQLGKFLDTQYHFKHYFMNHFILFSQLKRFLHESSRTLKLGLPVIIAQLLQTLMQFVDTVMADTSVPKIWRDSLLQRHSTIQFFY